MLKLIIRDREIDFEQKEQKSLKEMLFSIFASDEIVTIKDSDGNILEILKLNEIFEP